MKNITIVDKTTSTLYRVITINVDYISAVITWIDKSNNDSKTCKAYIRHDQYIEFSGESAEAFLVAYNDAIGLNKKENINSWQKIKKFALCWLERLGLIKSSSQD